MKGFVGNRGRPPPPLPPPPNRGLLWRNTRGTDSRGVALKAFLLSFATGCCESRVATVTGSGGEGWWERVRCRNTWHIWGVFQTTTCHMNVTNEPYLIGQVAFLLLGWVGGACVCVCACVCVGGGGYVCPRLILSIM